ITVRTGTGAGTSIEYNNKPGSHAGLTEIEASLMFVCLYPNPVNENTTLYFSLAKPSEVEINIFDVLGKNIKNIANKEFPAGFHSLPFTTGDMQKGIYFIRISDDSVTKVLKLQVL
ncbi:MAG: T9SS type A sorting domain-containing protein, partial [Bacteroidales bacterium]